jgi:hypothetical protein
MNKMLFALLVAAVSFGAMPMASAGKKVKDEEQELKIVGVQKRIPQTPMKRTGKNIDALRNRPGWAIDRKGNTWKTQLQTVEVVELPARN